MSLDASNELHEENLSKQASGTLGQQSLLVLSLDKDSPIYLETLTTCCKSFQYLFAPSISHILYMF